MKIYVQRLVIFFLLLLFVNTALCQSANTIKPVKDSAGITLAHLALNDGTKLWGVVLLEDENKILLRDFNTGTLSIEKKHIKSSEMSKTYGLVLIETINGTSFLGKITGLSGDNLLLDSQILGNIEIKTNSISKIGLSGTYLAKKQGTWFTNPNATRYFFAPSAIPLRKHEGYYQNAYLLANSVNVGLTNNIAIGGGVVIPLLFYVTPKISYKVASNLYMGAGVFFTQSFISGFDLSAGIGYGLVTVGNTEHNFTLGGGYGFAKMNKQYRSTPMPIVTLNGMTRISKRLSLVTENWLIPRGGYNEERTTPNLGGIPFTETVYVSKSFYSYAASFGLRFMPGIKTSVDFSVVAVKVNPNNNLIALPYLDFVYKFE